VSENIAAAGGVPEDAAWDSWRREDGRWTVLVTPRDADLPATFVFDVKSRYVLPADELAHELVGDIALPDSGDMAIADAVRSPERFTEPASVEAAASVDIPEPIQPAEEETLSGVSSLKEARDRRALEQLALGDVDEPQPSPAEAQHDTFEAALEDDIAVPDTLGPRKKRHERRRVPSWDEIMFGKDE
jgi:hypothetical protein